MNDFFFIGPINSISEMELSWLSLRGDVDMLMLYELWEPLESREASANRFLF